MHSSFNNTQIMLSPHSPLNRATVQSTFNYFLMCLLNHKRSFLVSKPGANRPVLLPAMSTYHRTGLSWSQSQVHTDRCCCQQGQTDTPFAGHSLPHSRSFLTLADLHRQSECWVTHTTDLHRQSECWVAHRGLARLVTN